VEGRVFVVKGNSIGLVRVSQLKDINCKCPACSDPILRRYVLDPSGARRNDVRMVHNIYTITRLLNERYANNSGKCQ
jgi:queuine/archaeosine tRNA-ribosyltransferase